MLNYTWPGRFHFIRSNVWRFYVTLWLFGHRFHIASALPPDTGQKPI